MEYDKVVRKGRTFYIYLSRWNELSVYRRKKDMFRGENSIFFAQNADEIYGKNLKEKFRYLESSGALKLR